MTSSKVLLLEGFQQSIASAGIREEGVVCLPCGRVVWLGESLNSSTEVSKPTKYTTSTPPLLCLKLAFLLLVHAKRANLREADGTGMGGGGGDTIPRESG